MRLGFKLPANKRVKFLRSYNICFKCVTAFHRKSNCKSTSILNVNKMCKNLYFVTFGEKFDSRFERYQLVTNYSNDCSLSATRRLYQILLFVQIVILIKLEKF